MFRTTLDSERNRLNSTGQYIHKRQAEAITVEDESLLLELGLVRYYLTNCFAAYTCVHGWAILCFKKWQKT